MYRKNWKNLIKNGKKIQNSKKRDRLEFNKELNRLKKTMNYYNKWEHYTQVRTKKFNNLINYTKPCCQAMIINKRNKYLIKKWEE